MLDEKTEKLKVRILRMDRTNKDLVKITHDYSGKEIKHHTSQWVITAIDFDGKIHKFKDNNEGYILYGSSPDIFEKEDTCLQ